MKKIKKNKKNRKELPRVKCIYHDSTLVMSLTMNNAT